MRKTMVIALIALFVLSVSAVAFAADKQVTGEITAIDAKAMTLTVKSKKAEVALTANDKTKVMMDKEAKTLSDFKAGDKVMVKYSVLEGKNVAKSISIKA